MKNKEHEIKYFEGRIKEAVDTRQYSIRRIDTLLLSISSAGYYVILETFKYGLEHNLHNFILLKLSGISFAFTIIFNFLSQFSSKKANEFDTQYSYRSLDNLVNGIDNQKEIDLADEHADIYSLRTNKFNNISLSALAVGLITLILYFMVTF